VARSAEHALQQRPPATPEKAVGQRHLKVVKDSRPIDPPRLNEAVGPQRYTIDEMTELVRREWMTAGASSTVAEPSTPSFALTLPRVFDEESVVFTATGGDYWNALQQDPEKYFVGTGWDPSSRTVTARTSGVSPFVSVSVLAAKDFMFFNVDPVASYQSVKRTVTRARDEALAEFRRRLDVVAATYAQMPPRDVVLYLTESLGLGQLTTARAVDVSPTAIRKWRRGDSPRPERRAQLAQFAALCDVLTESGVHDPASWLDIPVSAESTVTKLDLFVAGRGDLVLLLASGLSEPQETLDLFVPDWRDRFPTDAEYEVITLDDGSRAVVPRLERQPG
jgi:hypothetical protein